MSDSQQGMYARDIQMFPEPKPMQKVQKTKEEIFSESHFEWIKTERQGDISKFSYFVHENGVDYVVFQDGSRIREELVGDVVLMHQYPEEILGLPTAQPFESAVTQEIFSPTVYGNSSIIHKPVEIDPVVAILEKTKKKTEKITLTLNLKIPSPDLYGVIKENFENTDEILLQSIMDQIHDNVLREALKRELQVIYQKKKESSMIPSLEVVSLDGYQAVKTNNSAVAVVVYELDENGLLDKVGLITEKNPHFKNGTFSSLVMGKVESEDTSLFHRARIETLEEAGYEVEDPERWSFLGELYTSKIIVEPLYCYAVDITGISQGKINGDGSDQEKSLQFELVALSKIQEVNDSVFLSCVFKLFTNLYKNDLNNGIA